MRTKITELEFTGKLLQKLWNRAAQKLVPTVTIVTEQQEGGRCGEEWAKSITGRGQKRNGEKSPGQGFRGRGWE